MRRIALGAAYVAGILLMIGVYYFLRWMVFGFGSQFGLGFIAGGIFVYIVLWIAHTVRPEGILGAPRRERRLDDWQ